jgi:hypothetical protein
VEPVQCLTRPVVGDIGTLGLQDFENMSAVSHPVRC